MTSNTNACSWNSSKDNKIGVAGVAPDADLYAAKVLDAMGAGYLSDLAEGIEWCINNEIQLINLSVERKDYPLSYTATEHCQPI